MKKIRWLHAEWPASISMVSNELMLRQYSEDRGNGFLLSTANHKFIEGKYIEKQSSKSVVVDPFGNEIESLVTAYYVCKFYVDSSLEIIELRDPPRSIKKFISELYDAFGIGLEISDIQVDPCDWFGRVEKEISPLSVTLITASGIMVPKDGVARISVSGKSDIRKEFAKLITNKLHGIDNLRFVGDVDGCQFCVELSKTGTARFSGNIYDGLVDTIKNNLLK